MRRESKRKANGKRPGLHHEGRHGHGKEGIVAKGQCSAAESTPALPEHFDGPRQHKECHFGAARFPFRPNAAGGKRGHQLDVAHRLVRAVLPQHADGDPRQPQERGHHAARLQRIHQKVKVLWQLAGKDDRQDTMDDQIQL